MPASLRFVWLAAILSRPSPASERTRLEALLRGDSYDADAFRRLVARHPTARLTDVLPVVNGDLLSWCFNSDRLTHFPLFELPLGDGVTLQLWQQSPYDDKLIRGMAGRSHNAGAVYDLRSAPQVLRAVRQRVMFIGGVTLSESGSSKTYGIGYELPPEQQLARANFGRLPILGHSVYTGECVRWSSSYHCLRSLRGAAPQLDSSPSVEWWEHVCEITGGRMEDAAAPASQKDTILGRYEQCRPASSSQRRCDVSSKGRSSTNNVHKSNHLFGHSVVARAQYC